MADWAPRIMVCCHAGGSLRLYFLSQPRPGDLRNLVMSSMGYTRPASESVRDITGMGELGGGGLGTFLLGPLNVRSSPLLDGSWLQGGGLAREATPRRARVLKPAGGCGGP